MEIYMEATQILKNQDIVSIASIIQQSTYMGQLQEENIGGRMLIYPLQK